MKKTDMELQAIREKLLLLQAEPATAEVMSMPWGSAQQRPRTSLPSSRPSSQRQAPAPTIIENRPAHAAETLRQRSNVQTSAHANELITQEIERLQIHAQNINERSQQQAAEILAMRRSAQQAAVALRRQGLQDHPQLSIIEQFLEAYPSVAVPHLERDSSGQFCLRHSSVNLHHAEQEARSNAQALRNRRTPHPSYQPDAHSLNSDESHTYTTQSQRPEPFSQPISPSRSSASESLPEYPPTYRRRPKFSLTKLIRLFQTKPTEAKQTTGSFSLTDGLIWFSGAAIARIMLEAIVVAFPLLRMPLLILLFSIISFSIYRVVVSKSADLTPAYRLGITLLGLFLGGML